MTETSRYTVLMPDLFHGDPVPLNADMATFDLPNWMQGGLNAKKIPHFPQNVDPIVEQSIKVLREKYKVKVSYIYEHSFEADWKSG